MSCWTCESCGQKWCDLDECPTCDQTFDDRWDVPHLHEIINGKEPEYYEQFNRSQMFQMWQH